MYLGTKLYGHILAVHSIHVIE